MRVSRSTLGIMFVQMVCEMRVSRSTLEIQFVQRVCEMSVSRSTLEIQLVQRVSITESFKTYFGILFVQRVSINECFKKYLGDSTCLESFYKCVFQEVPWRFNLSRGFVKMRVSRSTLEIQFVQRVCENESFKKYLGDSICLEGL